MVCALLVTGLLAGSDALAQSSGNACIKEKIGGNPPCTANDVRIGTLLLVSNDNCVGAGDPFTCCTGADTGTCDGGPTSCVVGEDITVTMQATIESGPDRWASRPAATAIAEPPPPAGRSKPAPGGSRR